MPLLQLGEMEGAGGVFQHLIWRPSASQAAEVPAACSRSASGSECLRSCLGVMLWYARAVLTDLRVGDPIGPRDCSKSQGAIFLKFLAAFCFLSSRIQLGLGGILTAFSFALEMDSNYQSSSGIIEWLISLRLAGNYLMLSPQVCLWIQLCFIPHSTSVPSHPSLL